LSQQIFEAKNTFLPAALKPPPLGWGLKGKRNKSLGLCKTFIERRMNEGAIEGHYRITQFENKQNV